VTTVRRCPGCESDFHRTYAFGVEIDVCVRCGGTFLDPGEAEAQGVSLAALFETYGARDGGMSERRCPAHAQPLRRVLVSRGVEDLTIERAECCGGIFLDAEEARPLAVAARHATEIASRVKVDEVTTMSGAVFVLPTDDPFADAPQPTPMLGMLRGIFAAEAGPLAASPPIEATVPVARVCPRCGRTYEAERSGKVEIDVCKGCGSMFLDYLDVEVQRIPTATLFGVRNEGTRVVGRSQLPCPACNEPMIAIEIDTLAGPIVIDRAECCGGIFFDGGEHEAVVRVARIARSEEAERRFQETGQPASEAVNAAAAAWPALERAEKEEERERRLEAWVATTRALTSFLVTDYSRHRRRHRR
jgi:Zn-finger nucleic acid-binding protein